MKRSSVDIPPFILAGFLLTSLWWVTATGLYRWFSPSSLQSLSARAFDKNLQDILMMTALVLPWLTGLLAPRLRSTYSLYGLMLGGVMMAITLEFHYMSWILLLLSFVLLFGYSWLTENSSRKWLSAEPDVSSSQIWFYLTAMLLSIGILIASVERLSILVMDLYEDGARMASANAFLLGQTPFRDFVVHYGILQEIVRPILAFHIWGTTYEAYLRSGFWLSSFSTVFLFWISTQTVRRKSLAIVIGAILLWRSDLCMPDRAIFSILTIVFFCRELNTGKRLWMVLAGVSTAAAFLYSFEMGLTVCLGVTAYFMVTRRISDGLLPWTAGVLSALVLLGLYTVHCQSTGAFLRDLGALLFFRISTWANGLPSHFFTFHPFANRNALHTFLYINQIPMLSIVVLSYLLLKFRAGGVTVRNHAALLLAFLNFFQFFIYLGRSDFTHWCNASFLLIPLIALILDEILNWIEQPQDYGLTHKSISALFATVLGLPLVMVIWGRQPFLAFLSNGYPFRAVSASPVMPPNLRLPERWGAISGSSQELFEMAEVTQEIRTTVPPDGYFFDFSDRGVFYFLSARRNPTRFGMVEIIQGDRMRAECLRALVSHPPQAVLAYGSVTRLRCRADLGPIRDYILEHYQLRHQIGPWVFLVPK